MRSVNLPPARAARLDRSRAVGWSASSRRFHDERRAGACGRGGRPDLLAPSRRCGSIGVRHSFDPLADSDGGAGDGSAHVRGLRELSRLFFRARSHRWRPRRRGRLWARAHCGDLRVSSTRSMVLMAGRSPWCCRARARRRSLISRRRRRSPAVDRRLGGVIRGVRRGGCCSRVRQMTGGSARCLAGKPRFEMTARDSGSTLDG